MKYLKRLRYATLIFLTVGASIILGFLSFSGMFALWPVLPIAIGCFVLSLAVEGLIYYENIKRALKKFKPDFLKLELAEELLLEYVPTLEMETGSKTDEYAKAPDFFKDYIVQLELYKALNHGKLDEAGIKNKKIVNKKLRDMEKWFALQLFLEVKPQAKFFIRDSEEKNLPKNNIVYLKNFKEFFFVDVNGKLCTPTPAQMMDLPRTFYEYELHVWLKQHQRKYAAELKERQESKRFVDAGSILSAIFMTFGTTFLLSEAFLNIPLLAAISTPMLPYIILPMAIMAGLAYGVLTWQTFYKMQREKPLLERYKALKKDIRHLSWDKIPMIIMTISLFLLTTALTICTAGTWFTIVKHTRPIFTWMSKLPSVVIGMMTFVLGFSTWGFNVSNAFTTLQKISEESLLQKVKSFINELFDGVLKFDWQASNLLRLLNPFKIFLKLTYTPLKITFFILHLLSISVTGDQIPGVKKIVAILLGFISEGFEDWDYIFGHNKNCQGKHNLKSVLTERFSDEDEHSHEDDIPTKCLNFLFYPLYLAAASYDIWARKYTKEPSVSFKRAMEEMQDIEEEVSKPLENLGKSPSYDWEKQHTLYLIEKRQRKLSTFSPNKYNELEKLKQNLVAMDFENSKEARNGIFLAEEQKPIYKTNSNLPTLFFNHNSATIAFIKELPERTRGHDPIKRSIAPAPTQMLETSKLTCFGACCANIDPLIPKTNRSLKSV